MAIQSALLPGTMVFRGLTALKIRHAQLRLMRQFARAQREEVFRITRELADCTDRQLADLGLCRSDILAVAHGTYRGA